MRGRLTKVLWTLPTALISVPALAQTPAGRRDDWHNGWDMGLGFGHMPFGGLMMLLFWGGIIVVIVLAVRWFGGGSSQGVGAQPADKKPLDILHERFARGEIDNDEFEERKRGLSN